MMLDRHQIIKHGSDECRSAWNVSACDPSRCSSTLGPHSVRTVLSEGRNGPGDRAPPKISWRGRLALVCLRAQFGRTHHSEQVFRFRSRACLSHHCAPCNAGGAAAQRHRGADDALGPDSQMREYRGNGRPHRTIYWRIQKCCTEEGLCWSRQGRELSGSGTGTGTVPCVRPVGHRVDTRSRSTHH